MAYLDQTGLGRVWSKIKGLVNNNNILEINCGTISSLPATISNASVTANHTVIRHVLSNPSAMRSDWTIATSDGSLTISGTVSGSTSLQLYLAPMKGE